MLHDNVKKYGPWVGLVLFIILLLLLLQKFRSGYENVTTQDVVYENVTTQDVVTPDRAGNVVDGIARGFITEATQQAVDARVDDAYKCPAGNYSFNGVRPCIACPPGTFCDVEGMKVPTPCPPGTYCRSGGMKAATPCPPNTYCPSLNMIIATSCPLGSTSPPGSVSAQACISIKCPAGSYLAGGSCFACPPGTFCDVEGMKVPTPCPPGKYCRSGGMKAATPCPPNTYCPSLNTIIPVYCPPGSTSNEGSAVCTPNMNLNKPSLPQR